MKNVFKKVNIGQVATIATTVIGVASVLLGNVVDKNNRANLKAELKEEILKEINNK